MGAAALVRRYLESDAGHDLLAEMVKMTAELLMDAEADLLAFATFPVEHRRQIWSNNTWEQLNKELAAGPTWSASSRTDPHSCASVVPCSPNSTTSG